MDKRSQRFVGYAVAVLSAATWIAQRVLAAGPAPVPAPEVDGASISAGLGLVAAAVLIIRSRRQR